MQAAQWALMPSAIWLAGVAGPEKHDIVVRWGWDPEWLAPLPCGVRWDALALGDGLGLTALEALRAGDTRASLGPVLHDQGASLTFWLLPIEAGAADMWRQIAPTAQVLSTGQHLQAPDPESGPGVSSARWVNWPAITGTLTPPDLLAAALQGELHSGANP